MFCRAPKKVKNENSGKEKKNNNDKKNKKQESVKMRMNFWQRQSPKMAFKNERPNEKVGGWGEKVTTAMVGVFVVVTHSEPAAMSRYEVSAVSTPTGMTMLMTFSADQFLFY